MELFVSLCDPGNLSVLMENTCEGVKTVSNRDQWCGREGGRTCFLTWRSYLVGVPDPNQLRGESRKPHTADAPV